MNRLVRKIATVGVAIVTVVSLSGVAPAFAQTSAADLQAQITQLLALIQTLQAQLAAQAGGAVAPSYSFTRSLTVGSVGADVKALQQWLNANGYTVAASGAGSVGKETTYFGALTKAAVAKYQAAKGITPAVGYFGPKTRAAVAAAAPVTPVTPSGVTPPVVIVPAGTDLQVSLAADSPSARTIGSGTAFNPAIKVALTTGAKAVSVTGITLQKSGFVANTNLNGVDIVDSKGVRHGQVVTSVNADNTITILMSTAPITIPANSTEYILVRFNLLSSASSGTVSFGISAVSSITADTTAIAGAFPITGSIMNIVSGTSSLASTTLDVLTGTGSSTLNVNAADLQEITKFRIQEVSSNEGINLYSLTLYNAGTAADASYKDVTLIAPDGSTVLATAQSVGKYVVFNLATPYFIDKGQTKDFTVKAKLVDGAAQTVNLEVYNNYDIDLRGATTLVSVIPGVGSKDTAFPIGNGFNIQIIGSGSLTQMKATDSPSSAVVPGATSVVLAKYTVKPTGENYELRAVKFYVASSSGVTKLSGTVYVKVNDAIVYSVAASSISVTTSTEYTLSSYPVITSGVNSTITISADINSSATSADNYQVKSFQITTAKRITTNDIVTNPTSATDANSIAVKSATLVVTTLATPVANSVVAGTSQYEYSTIKLDASTGGEDVKVSKITITTGSGNLTEVQNLNLYKDSETSPLVTTASTAANAATVAFNFSSPVVVTRATPVTLHLKADVVSGTNAHAFYIASSSGLTAVGSETGNTISDTSSVTFSGLGQNQTHVASGRLIASVGSGSPTLDQVAGVGTLKQTFFAINLTSQYAAQKLTKLQVYASSTLAGLATTTLANVGFYEGNASTAFATPVPTCVSDVSSTWCTYSATASDNLLSAPIPVSGTTIYVKADVGAGGSARLGDAFKMMIISTSSDITAKDANGKASTVVGTPAVTGWTYIASGPVTIEADNTQIDTTVNTAAGMSAGIFKITNNSGATIRLSTSTTFKFNQSGSATSSFDLYIGNSPGAATTRINAGNVGQATTASGFVNFQISTSSVTDREIGIGAAKYLVIKNTDVTATGGTWAFSVGALGQIMYQVDNTSLGYDSDPYEAVVTPTDLTGVAQGLYVGLNPASGPANSIISISTSY